MAKKNPSKKTKPFIPTGPYTKPKLTAIELDPGQAILVSCKVGGGYIDQHGGCENPRVGGHICVAAARLPQRNAHTPAHGGTTTDEMPS